MALSVMDQVALGKTFEGSSGPFQSRRLPGDRGSTEATGLLTLISYLLLVLPQVNTPVSRPSIRILCLNCVSRGISKVQGSGVRISACS